MTDVSPGPSSSCQQRGGAARLVCFLQLLPMPNSLLSLSSSPYTPPFPASQHFVPAVTAIFVLDNDGQRLSAKYFSPLFTNNADMVRAEGLEKRGGREGGRGDRTRWKEEGCAGREGGVSSLYVT